jgi:hypothetical protein
MGRYQRSKRLMSIICFWPKPVYRNCLHSEWRRKFGAQMGQFIRQSMPFNANYAFMHALESATNTNKDGRFASVAVNTRAQLAYGRLHVALQRQSDGQHQ